MSAPTGMPGIGALSARRLLEAPPPLAVSSPLRLRRISPDVSKRSRWPCATVNPVLVHGTFEGTTTERAFDGAFPEFETLGVVGLEFGNPDTFATDPM